MRRLCKLLMALTAGVWLPAIGFGLTGGDVILLKKAGISDTTIQLMIYEKTVETRAFTVEEILALKKAGLSEKTLRMLIESNSFMKDREPVVYGKAVQPLSLTTAQDVIALKKAGISDEVVQAILLAVCNQQDDQTRRAWEMLRDLDIEIDYRP